MDVFCGFGCNICYKTDDGSLTDISEENMKDLKDTLITFVGHTDIIKYKEIYLCQYCCDELIRFDKFRELCYSHLIQSPQTCFNMLSKLDLEGGNMLKTSVHEENSVLKCDEFRVAFTNEEDIKNVIKRSGHTKLETFDISNVSDTSQIQFMKKEIDSNDEIESTDSEIFTLSSFENKSEANPDVKEPVLSDSSDAMKQELHVKQENSNSEGVTLERIEVEDGEHVTFEIANVCTIVNVGNGGNEDIRNQKDKIGRKLRSRRRKSKTTPAIINTHPSRVYVRESCNGRSRTALQSIASKRLKSSTKLPTCVAEKQTFKTRSSLVRHDSDDRPYKCTLCNKAFIYPSALIDHERTHSGDKPYKCTLCNKSFAYSSYLTIHERIHSGDKPYKCILCNKAFTISSNLTTHERIHSGDKPYKCKLCNKAFANSSNLTIHERIHSGEKPYKCVLCNKAYAHSSNLTIHERIHSGDKPYKCTLCNKAYAQSHHLTRHERIHSGDKP